MQIGYLMGQGKSNVSRKAAKLAKKSIKNINIRVNMRKSAAKKAVLCGSLCPLR